ncbi:8289_t:CDS:2 [Entrophospora sp. SA101]|nr:8289_t:CDS:2 [Entrophospora sp. SA101]
MNENEFRRKNTSFSSYICLSPSSSPSHTHRSHSSSNSSSKNYFNHDDYWRELSLEVALPPLPSSDDTKFSCYLGLFSSSSNKDNKTNNQQRRHSISVTAANDTDSSSDSSSYDDFLSDYNSDGGDVNVKIVDFQGRRDSGFFENDEEYYYPINHKNIS